MSWDGRDERGALVPPEAYAYTVTLTPLSAEEPVTYDLRPHTGGDYVEPTHSSFELETGTIRYGLSRKSRVHLLLSDGAAPRRTALDWAPRLAGGHEERWPDSTEAKGAVLRAVTLADNVVLVRGTPERSKRTEGPPAGELPVRLEAPSARPLYQHALHPRARCYDPAVVARFLGDVEVDASGAAWIEVPSTLRLELAKEQPPGRIRPDSRVSVYLYVDGELRFRELQGYLPYQWTVDPSELGPGEHRVTAVVAWREGHSGLVHRTIRIHPPATD